MPLEELRPEQLPHSEVLLIEKDVIGQITTHLKANEVEPAISLHRRCPENVGYELMNLVEGGPHDENLTIVFLGARNDYKAAQVFEKLGALDAAVNAFELAEASDLAAELNGRLGKCRTKARSKTAAYFDGRLAQSRRPRLFPRYRDETVVVAGCEAI